MDRKLQEAKNIYKSVHAPENLEPHLQQIIKENKTTRHNGRPVVKYALTIAAACLIFSTAALNISPHFADAAAEFPVFGNLAQVLTVREYIDGDATYLAGTDDGTEITDEELLEKYVNEQINAKTSAIIAEAEANAQKMLNIELNGEKSDYQGIMPAIFDVTYEIYCQTSDVLSFVINTTHTQASALNRQYFYNVNPISNAEIGLHEILGDDYISICNTQIKEQIAQREAADVSNVYYHDEQEFQSISPNQKFYINDKGNVVISFEKDVIAPKEMGVQTFEIVKDK